MKYLYMILAGTLAYLAIKKNNDDTGNNDGNNDIIVPNFEEQIINASKKAFGKLSSTQLNSIKALFFEWKVYNELDVNKLIYIIATSYHESRLGALPKEIRDKPGTITYERQQKYWNSGYYGRGLIQITWKANYEKFAKILKIDLVNNPDLALNTQIAAKIAILGMYEGLFTGAKLSKYINSSQADYYNARRVVNGLDRAELISNYGISLYESLYGKIV